jgi:hypothetical protein
MMPIATSKISAAPIADAMMMIARLDKLVGLDGIVLSSNSEDVLTVDGGVSVDIILLRDS